MSSKQTLMLSKDFCKLFTDHFSSYTFNIKNSIQIEWQPQHNYRIWIDEKINYNLSDIQIAGFLQSIGHLSNFSYFSLVADYGCLVSVTTKKFLRTTDFVVIDSSLNA